DQTIAEVGNVAVPCIREYHVPAYTPQQGVVEESQGDLPLLLEGHLVGYPGGPAAIPIVRPRFRQVQPETNACAAPGGGVSRAGYAGRGDGIAPIGQSDARRSRTKGRLVSTTLLTTSASSPRCSAQSAFLTSAGTVEEGVGGESTALKTIALTSVARRRN